MKMFKHIAFAAMMVMSLTANAQMTSQNVLGNLIGGAIGGAAGSQVGKGNGRTAAIIGGTMLGTYVGNRVSSDDQPRQVVSQPSRQNDGYTQTTNRLNERQPSRAYTQDDGFVSYNEPPQTRRAVPREQPRQQARQHVEKYFYTVQGESGRPIQMVGCAAYDEREQASRPVDIRQCDNQQTTYIND